MEAKTGIPPEAKAEIEKVFGKVQEAKIKNFSELQHVKKIVPEHGRILSALDVLDKEIIVQGYILQDSRFRNGKYAIVDIILDGKITRFTTGSYFVLAQLEASKNDMPYRTVLRRFGRRFFFT